MIPSQSEEDSTFQVLNTLLRGSADCGVESFHVSAQVQEMHTYISACFDSQYLIQLFNTFMSRNGHSALAGVRCVVHI